MAWLSDELRYPRRGDQIRAVAICMNLILNLDNAKDAAYVDFACHKLIHSMILGVKRLDGSAETVRGECQVWTLDIGHWTLDIGHCKS